ATTTTSDKQPPWDRSIELVWTRRIPARDEGDREDEHAFGKNLIRLAQDIAKADPCSPSPDTSTERLGNQTCSPKDNTGPSSQLTTTPGENSAYFTLPDTVRFKVMKCLIANHDPHHKPIRMNSPVFLWEVWPVNKASEPNLESTDYFDSLQSVLSSVENYTSVCSAMRADVLATLFLTRRFHVVYSPYVTKGTQPAATSYMDQYGPLMASITLEVDFTKLAGSLRPEAVHLDTLKGLKGVKTLLEDFVQCQHTRHNTTIRDLRVLVRRYHGFRPTDPSDPPSPPGKENDHHTPTSTPPPRPPLAPLPISTNQPPPEPHPSADTATPKTPQPTPYTSATHIAHTLSPLKSLGPLVSTLTLTGAPHSFATELLS
ncbi:uncharacterized protein B0H64DRAFT_298904, partial [Chaetomium fimeti]